MVFWRRSAKKVRPDRWIRAESQSLTVEARVLEMRRASISGTRYPTSEAVVQAAAPTYQAVGRLTGKAEAVKGLAFHLSVNGSLDGYLYQDVAQLHEFAFALYRDYQQSLGLMLFYPDLNGRLLPPGSTGDDYDKALQVGADAQSRFIEYWKSEGTKYNDGQGGSGDAYQELMSRYAADTGRTASRLSTDTPPPDIVPPLVINLEFRDGGLRESEEGQ